MHNDRIINKFYSQKSLYEPVPWINPNHWINKNRHPWSDAEKDNLYYKEMGDFEIDIRNCDLLVTNFNPNDVTLIKKYGKDSTKIYCGQVIKIGGLAFDKATFPLGASCTYNDWVEFPVTHAEYSIVRDKLFWRVMDNDIIGLIKHPSDILVK